MRTNYSLGRPGGSICILFYHFLQESSVDFSFWDLKRDLEGIKGSEKEKADKLNEVENEQKAVWGMKHNQTTLEIYKVHLADEEDILRKSEVLQKILLQEKVLKQNVCLGRIGSKILPELEVMESSKRLDKSKKILDFSKTK